MGRPLFEHVLMIGATSGIGQAMAERFANEGVKVTAVGRRQDRLDAFAQRHKQSGASTVQFDISALDAIPQFARDVTRTHPDIDCVFLNAGVQRRFQLSDRHQFDLASLQDQTVVNYTSLVALAHAFLPFLSAKSTPTSLVFTGSNLAIVPAPSLAAYSASKAALNAFVLCLREELRDSTVRVIELSPPAVQTELHDYMGEESGRAIGMPLDQYIEVTYRRLAAGEEEIVVGTIGPEEDFNDIINKRRAAFVGFAKLMRGEK